MPRSLSQGRRVALVVSLAIHIVIMALLFFGGMDQARPRPERGLNVIAVMSDRDKPEQPEQVAEEPEVDVTPQSGETTFPVELPMVKQEAASSGSDGQSCAIAAAIQADLMANDAARAEIAAIPYQSRSVANAIVLWTGAPEHVRPALPIVDALIRRQLESLPAACLDVEQTGPDLIYAMVDNNTVAIAIGSGRWRWRNFFDLLTPSVRPLLPTARISPAPEN